MAGSPSLAKVGCRGVNLQDKAFMRSSMAAELRICFRTWPNGGDSVVIMITPVYPVHPALASPRSRPASSIVRNP